MISDSAEHHEAVVAGLTCIIRDAQQLAELTADFLDRSDLVPSTTRGKWTSAFLIELGAALRIRNWEFAGIKDSIDSSLPTFDTAFAELTDRFQTEPERLIRGETPLAQRVLLCWWFTCAHPKEQRLQTDMALSGVERNQLLSCVAQLLWRLRDMETNPVNTTD